VCPACAAGVFMGTMSNGTPAPVAGHFRPAGEATGPARQSVRAA